MAPANPIIPGFAPDPSIVRIDDTFYLVNSSFHLFPGLPIFSSKDLISWAHIGNAINRPSQLSLSASTTIVHNKGGPPDEVLVGTGGLYAPTIRHNRGRTYIVCTNVRHCVPEGEKEEKADTKNFIIFTDDIMSNKWSDPVYHDYWGIDPDLFFDDDGRAYVTGSYWNTNPKIPGTLNCFEIDLETCKQLGPGKPLWGGSSKIIPEGPHIYKRGEWYYILAAEGGTHEGHRLSMARSKNLWGPYEECPHNPVLKPSPGDKEYQYVQYNGHGDLVEDAEGNWWLVFLAVRKDKGGSGQLPILGQPFNNLLSLYRPPKTPTMPPLPHDPKVDLVYIRDPDFEAYEITDDARTVTLKASASDLSDASAGPVSFLGKRQRSLQGEASAALSIGGATEPVTAGLAYYKDEYRYARIFYDFSRCSIWFEWKNGGRRRTISNKEDVLLLDDNLASNSKVRFSIVHSETTLDFRYRLENDGATGNDWVSAAKVNTLDLTDRDFTGPCLGVFATTNGALTEEGGPTSEFKCIFTDLHLVSNSKSVLVVL
ncbi:hypothetical protein NM208_g760 [Fusarium decemcellulare]|uniref:Uncharacterized protein n=1 Tax=Fusarium decemcellulare TaxID=57161 RepID=A0ACC1SY78_9HYPO|nr:hypothetical protein NM208_g760 [Fusarium decemcellulare]